MSIKSELDTIKALSDNIILTKNKVSRFAYTQSAYDNNQADSVLDYDVERPQNIPEGTSSVMKVNQTVIDKGYRARASSLTRMLMNHFFGRISYNLNKINDWFNSILGSISSYLGEPNGIATLDGNGRIPYSQLPESAIELKGYWNASTNTPILVDGIGNNGDEYIVSVAGTRDLGSGSQYFGVGDRVLYTSGIWKNISSGFVRTINNIAPNPQGEISVVLGKNNLPIAKGFLSAFFGKLMAKSWTQGTGANTSYTMRALVYANGLWVCGGDHGIWWSENGKNWTRGTGISTSYSVYYLVYANGLWVCGSRNHGMWWSEDGKSWTQGTGANTTYVMQYLVYANGLWVCGSSDHGIWWSEDGKSWTQGTGANTTYDIYSLVYANGLWVCGGDHGIWWSEDGKSWTQGTGISTSYSVNSLVYANGLWACVNYDGIYWSENGKSWTQGTGLDAPHTMQSLVYANGLWFCGSFGHAIWWSEDGKNWTQGTGATSMEALVYANGLWVCGSSDHGIWWSEDGKSWTQGTGLSTTSVIGALVYANGLWVCGSSDHGIWWSENGKSWTQGTGANTSYTMRALVYANGLWVCGSSYHGMWWGTDIEELISKGIIDFGASIPLVNS